MMQRDELLREFFLDLLAGFMLGGWIFGVLGGGLAVMAIIQAM